MRSLAGAVLLLAVAVVVATSWDQVVSNHPAYPLSLMLTTAAAIVLIVSDLRRVNPPRHGAARLTLRVAGVLAALGAAAFLVWLRPLPAAPEAVAAAASTSSVTVEQTRTGMTFEPAEDAEGVLVLYPGGRVDPRAYSVLASRIAAAGFRVVVPKCPFDLEVLCPSAADAAVAQARDEGIPVAVGGHSLGGVVAARYAARHDTVDGLVLWAAYPYDDVSGRTDLQVLTLLGEDDPLVPESDAKAESDLLPRGARYVVLDGGVHSYFGDYGVQPGDGSPGAERPEVQEQIVARTVAFLEGLDAPASR